MLRKTPLKPISDKRRKLLEQKGLPMDTFSLKEDAPKKQPIKAKSDTRTAEDKKYKLACIQSEMDNIKKYGELTCEFCRMPMYEELPEHHHVAGRAGDLYTNPKGLWIAHAACHSVGPKAYHSLALSQQVNQYWFPRLLDAVKQVDEAKFRVMLGKAEEHGYKHIIKED